MARRAFVTGGGGYVGSRLCSQLAERGYTVTAFDLHYPDEDQGDGIQRIKVDTGLTCNIFVYRVCHSFVTRVTFARKIC